MLLLIRRTGRHPVAPHDHSSRIVHRSARPEFAANLTPHHEHIIFPVELDPDRVCHGVPLSAHAPELFQLDLITGIADGMVLRRGIVRNLLLSQIFLMISPAAVASVCTENRVDILKVEGDGSADLLSGARRLKNLEDENRRLKKLVAESMMDNSPLKEMLGKSF